jgi:hypothetical protein
MKCFYENFLQHFLLELNNGTSWIRTLYSRIFSQLYHCATTGGRVFYFFVYYNCLLLSITCYLSISIIVSDYFIYR